MSQRRSKAPRPVPATPKAVPEPSAIVPSIPQSSEPVGRVLPQAKPKGASAVQGLVLGGLLLVIAAAHLVWRVEPSLRYQAVAPPFALDAGAWSKAIAVPGGGLRRAAAGMAQLGFHDLLGALGFTVALALVGLAANGVFRAVRPSSAAAGAAGLVMVLAVLPGRYEAAAEVTVLGILCALLAGWLHTLVRAKSLALSLTVAWAGALAVFAWAGSLPLLLSTVILMVIEIQSRRSVGRAIAHGAGVLLLVAWCWSRPGYAPFATLNDWGTGLTRGVHAAAFLWVPVWLGLSGSGVGSWVRARAARCRPRWLADCGRGKTMNALVGLAAVIWLWAALDTSRRELARLERSVARQDWADALAAGRAVRSWTAPGRLHLTRALFHAGRLPDDLFAYPQTRGADILPGYGAGLEINRALGETLLELGQVNLAEHLAHEALELEGPRPDTLGLLADINLLKGRPAAARVFLKRLALVPFWRPEAERRLQALAADPAGANRPELGVIRARLVRTDEPDSWLPPETLLRQLLDANRTNRMAYAYLVAHRLLEGQLAELVADLDRSPLAVSAGLSRPCEEALLFYRDASPAATAAVQRWRISPATTARYKRFIDMRGRYSDPLRTRAALASEFGDSFWFYFLYGESGSANVRAAVPATP